jgi:hypothetical protein
MRLSYSPLALVRRWASQVRRTPSWSRTCPWTGQSQVPRCFRWKGYWAVARRAKHFGLPGLPRANRATSLPPLLQSQRDCVIQPRVEPSHLCPPDGSTLGYRVHGLPTLKAVASNHRTPLPGPSTRLVSRPALLRHASWATRSRPWMAWTTSAERGAVIDSQSLVIISLQHC